MDPVKENVDLHRRASKSIGLHNKQIMMELITESTSMETKMLQASKHYYLISNLIFFPSIILNTFIGSIVLSFNCYVGGGEACIINGQVDINCLQNNLGNLNIGDTTTVVFMQYFLAALAFLNAVLIGAQKAIKPGEQGEMFQLMARRWGAFLRQMVAYKQTTSTTNIKSRKVRSFLNVFNNLVENSPLLPRWLLRSSTRRKKKLPAETPTRTHDTKYNAETKGSKNMSVSHLNVLSFLTNVKPGDRWTPGRAPGANHNNHSELTLSNVRHKSIETPRLFMGTGSFDKSDHDTDDGKKEGERMPGNLV